MRRPIAPIACALALITGAWFGQAYSLFASPAAVVTPAGNRAAEAAVWRFYDAVDTLLRTGDATDLRAALAPDFVDHAEHPGLPPTVDGLVRYLSLLPHSFPGLRLHPDNLLVQGDRVVAQVELAGVSTGSFLGLPLAGSHPWTSVDIFRVSGDQIIEHWGDARSQEVAEPLFSETITVPPGSDLVPVLERITLAPGAADETRSRHAPAVILAETGEVTVMQDGVPTVLPTGAAIVVPANLPFATQNRTATTAVAVVLRLSLSTWPAAPGQSERRPDTPPLPPGIITQVLADSMATTVDPGTQTIAFGRITLAPGAQVAPHETVGTELLFVEDGRLTAIFPGESTRYWVRRSTPSPSSTGNVELLEPSAGLSVSPNVVASYRNDDATLLSLLVVTILPGSGSRSSAQPERP